MDHQYSSWIISTHHGSSVFIMDHQYSSWIFSTHHGSSVFIMNHQFSSWIIGTHHESSILIMDHQYSSWIISAHHGSSCINTKMLVLLDSTTPAFYLDLVLGALGHPNSLRLGALLSSVLIMDHQCSSWIIMYQY
jgi:hypothetical protein